MAATLDRPLSIRTRHGRFTVRHASLLPTVLRCVRTLDAVVERRECGANTEGGGGFQPGNTCGKGGQGSGEDGGGSGSGGDAASGADSKPYAERHAESKARLSEKMESLIGRNKQNNGDHEHATDVRENLSFVADRMTPESISRVESNVKHMSMYSTTEELSSTVARLTGKETSSAVGGYNADLGVLHMDGGPDPRGTLAHELTHAIDGPNYEISSSAEWQAAWDAEIKPGGISNYAATKPSEGLAEFGRALFAGQLPAKELRTEYPECWKVLKKYKVVP